MLLFTFYNEYVKGIAIELKRKIIKQKNTHHPLPTQLCIAFAYKLRRIDNCQHRVEE